VIAARAHAAALSGALALGAAAGCDLERMRHQERAATFAPSPHFDDGMAMRAPPAGTVPHDRPVGDPLVLGGLGEAGFAERVPIPVDRALLARGRADFEIVCAACHGLRGDGVSQVAENMELVRPPSLLAERVRALPPGRIFRVITLGWGLMPAFAIDLPIERRWGVVAYLRALQRSQAVALAELPPAWQARARRALP